MSFEPKRLPETSYEDVQQALLRFYNLRPDEYGLLDRPQKAYDDYCKLIAKFTPEKNSTILDVGSGSWRLPDTIANYGFKKVVGLDYFSNATLDKYKSKLTNTNVELFNYQEENIIPFPDNTFDVVCSLCVIEHLIYPEKILIEMDRVLKPDGILIISCPNWSGINVPIMALMKMIHKKDRFWRFNTISDSFWGIFRSIKWWFEVSLSKETRFILIYPRMKGKEIDFERSDDDAVHLCQPKSFKKFFNKLNYKFLKYNRGSGETTYSKLFNCFFPSMATTNTIVVKK